MKIYTKTGDDGTTGLLGNVRVRKDHVRIEAYGELDELNAAIGLILAHLPTPAEKARGWLNTLQSDLFVVGTLLATPAQEARAFVVLTADRADALETQIDQMEQDLAPLKNFILPQGTPASSFAHLARAISRRAERRTVALSAVEPVDPLILIFINRVSDFLFVLARWINHRDGGTETAWINPTGDVAGAPMSPTPDRMNATLQKLEDDKRKRQTLFEKAAADLEKKKRIAEQAFQQNVDQIKKDGGKVEKPFREIDLD